jgi:hypothetical protein
MSIYACDPNGNWFVQMGLYTSAGSLVANTSAVDPYVFNCNPTSWSPANFTVSPTLSAATNYYLAFNSLAYGVYVYYDFVSPDRKYYSQSYGTWRSSVTWATQSGQSYKYSLYVTYAVPATVTTSAATSVTNNTATLNGNVTAVGSDNPTVTVYWGTSDGGTTPGNWNYSSAPTSPSQPQGVAAFTKNVTGLSPGVKYYFTASGTNTSGTSWGTTQNFTTTGTTVVGKGIDTYSLIIDGSLNVTGYISGSASSTTQITKAWHHVVMTYDGFNIKLYVDGVLKVTTAKTGAIATNNFDFKMGASMAGKLDDMRVYNRALSQTEITALYESY